MFRSEETPRSWTLAWLEEDIGTNAALEFSAKLKKLGLPLT
jgi:hypothetical protein